MSIRRQAPKLFTTMVAAMLAQVAALFLREWVSRVLIDSGIEPRVARLNSAFAGFAVLLVFIGPLLLQHRHMLRAMLAQPANATRLFLEAIGIGFALRLVSWGIVILDSSFDPGTSALHAIPPAVGAAWQCPDVAYAALFLLTLAIVTPLLEEIVGRGLILGLLLARRTRIALPASAILFAVLHTPGDMPLAFAFGMVAGVMVCASRSLWGAIVSHATANALLLFDPGCVAPGILDGFLLALPSPTRSLIGSLLIAFPLLAAFHCAFRTGAGR